MWLVTTKFKWVKLQQRQQSVLNITAFHSCAGILEVVLKISACLSKALASFVTGSSGLTAAGSPGGKQEGVS